MAVTVCSALPSIALSNWLMAGLGNSIFIVVVSMVGATLSMYLIGLDREWRFKVKQVLFSRLSKIGGAK